MSLQVLRLVVLLGCVALPLVVIASQWQSKSSYTKGYLLSETNHEMKFRKPLRNRVGLASLSLWPCFLLALLFLLQGSSSTHRTENHGSAFVPLALFGLLIFLFLSQTGPCDVDLDIARRVYRWRWGAFWRPRLRTGTWDDLSGIYVKKLPKSKDEYLVGLRWKGTWRACALGTFQGRDNANRFATSTAGKLHLPLVEQPPQPQMQDVFKG